MDSGTADVVAGNDGDFIGDDADFIGDDVGGRAISLVSHRIYFRFARGLAIRKHCILVPPIS